MKMIYMPEDDEVRDFAKRAARLFAKHKECRTHTDGDIEAGCLFALRWGWNNDCVVVFRLDEDFEPINYQELIKGQEVK